MARTTKKKGKAESRNNAQELNEALTILEKEKNISRETMLKAIEEALITAYDTHFLKREKGKAERADKNRKEVETSEKAQAEAEIPAEKEEEPAAAAEAAVTVPEGARGVEAETAEVQAAEAEKTEKEKTEKSNVKVTINPDTCEYHVYALKTVVEEVEDPVYEISLAEAQMKDPRMMPGDIVQIEINSEEFSRTAAKNAKNKILQTIREEEKNNIYEEFHAKERQIVTGIVQRYIGKNVSVNLGNVDALLTEKEMVRGEHFEPTERIKVLIVKVTKDEKGTRIHISRTHPDFVRRLFEQEVAEVRDGTVEIKAIAREAGSRTKMAVWSNDPDVDPVGACVGMNGSRVNAVVDELDGEKIDIINWNDNPAMLIENALSPAKVISVLASADENDRSAKVVVPDYQLSLAIGKEGQNVRLAHRLTNFSIDIKSETDAREAGFFDEYEEYENEEYEEDYGEEGEYKDGGYEDEEELEEYSGEFDEENAAGEYDEGGAPQKSADEIEEESVSEEELDGEEDYEEPAADGISDGGPEEEDSTGQGDREDE